MGRSTHLTPAKRNSINPLMLAVFLKSPRLSLQNYSERYCKADLDVKLVFSTFKLRNMFSVKDSVPQSLRSRVVYKFLVCWL